MGKKKDKDKGKSKESKGKKCCGIFACGKKYSIQAGKFWDGAWRQMLELGQDLKPGEPLPLRYCCKKCKRLSPVKSYLCKPEEVED